MIRSAMLCDACKCETEPMTSWHTEETVMNKIIQPRGDPAASWCSSRSLCDVWRSNNSGTQKEKGTAEAGVGSAGWVDVAAAAYLL